MKTVPASFRLFFTLGASVLLLAGPGCVRDDGMNSTAERKRIPLAPVGAVSPGIGAPGAGSADTRATGTVATGQGDTPLAEPDAGAVPVSAAGITPGARKGGRL